MKIDGYSFTLKTCVITSRTFLNRMHDWVQLRLVGFRTIKWREPAVVEAVRSRRSQAGQSDVLSARSVLYSLPPCHCFDTLIEANMRCIEKLKPHDVAMESSNGPTAAFTSSQAMP